MGTENHDTSIESRDALDVIDIEVIVDEVEFAWFCEQYESFEWEPIQFDEYLYRTSLAFEHLRKNDLIDEATRVRFVPLTVFGLEKFAAEHNIDADDPYTRSLFALNRGEDCPAWDGSFMDWLSAQVALASERAWLESQAETGDELTLDGLSLGSFVDSLDTIADRYAQVQNEFYWTILELMLNPVFGTGERMLTFETERRSRAKHFDVIKARLDEESTTLSGTDLYRIEAHLGEVLTCGGFVTLIATPDDGDPQIWVWEAGSGHYEQVFDE